MLPVPLHQFVGIGQQNGGSQERHVNKNLPLHMSGFSFAISTKDFEQMDAGDSDQGSRQLDFDGARVYMGEPFRAVGMSLEIQLAHECGIAADNDHGQKIRHHRHVDQSQHASA